MVADVVVVLMNRITPSTAAGPSGLYYSRPVLGR